jgi:MerR family transcriptional regulator, light-induced transcriptional regulator
VIYLGPDLPAAEIAGAATESRADMVGLSVVFVDDRSRVLREVLAVRDALSISVPLLVGGAGAAAIAPDLAHPGVRVVRDLGALRAGLRAWRGGGARRAADA